eukprot:13677206-Alexandrium_andersonii.AAC.1
MCIRDRVWLTARRTTLSPGARHRASLLDREPGRIQRFSSSGAIRAQRGLGPPEPAFGGFRRFWAVLGAAGRAQALVGA